MSAIRLTRETGIGWRYTDDEGTTYLIRRDVGFNGKPRTDWPWLVYIEGHEDEGTILYGCFTLDQVREALT